jgi:hypothetical protein
MSVEGRFFRYASSWSHQLMGLGHCYKIYSEPLNPGRNNGNNGSVMARTLKFRKETETAPRPYLAIQWELQNTVQKQQQIF